MEFPKENIIEEALKKNKMKTINLKQINWQKVLLYAVLIIFIFAYVKSCSSENDAVLASELATKKADSISNVASKTMLENELLQAELKDQKEQYKVIEKQIYKVSSDLVLIKKETSKRIYEARNYTNKEMQGYFDSNYSVSVSPIVHLDSIVSKDIIVDLEVGKGAVVSNVKLLEKDALRVKEIDNLSLQNKNLETQNQNSLIAYQKEKEASELYKKDAADNLDAFKKERRRKNWWKFASIPAFILGVFIAK